MDQMICIRGAKAICEAVGENPRDILELVERQGLPAWRRSSNGSWRALPEDLHDWLKDMRNKCMASSEPEAPFRDLL